jgi:CubicO group peptidase (beta-lactamase class C family)
VLALTAACAALATGCDGSTDDTDSRLQAVIDGMTRDVFVGNGITGRRQLFHLPAAALTVNSTDDKSRTFVSGTADLSSREVPRASDIQPIGSNTKVVTAVLVMRLVQDGKLQLEERVPAIAARFGGEKDPLSELVSRYQDRLRRVTLRELLNHTSGLADSLDSNGFAAAFSKSPLATFTLSQLASFGLEEPPVFPPGAPGRWNYSNTDYQMLGLILEAVTGQPVGGQMQALFDEARMTRTHYSPSPAQMQSPPIAGSLIHGYMPGTGPNAKQPAILSVFDDAPTATTKLEPAAVQIVSTNPSESGPTVQVTPADAKTTRQVRKHPTFTYKDVTNAYSLSIAQTAGGIVTNTEDLATFWRALFEGKLVSRNTLTEMEQTVPTGENSKGVQVRWGLGFGQQQIDPGVLYPGSPRLTVWMHLGDIFGWESAAYYVPQEDLVVTNTDNLFPTPVGDLGLLRKVLRVEIEGD